MSDIDNIKKSLEKKEAIIGTERVIKGLKIGKLRLVYLTSNIPDSVKKDIEYYSKLSNAQIVYLDCPNDEFGTLCKKPFSISVLGISK